MILIPYIKVRVQPLFDYYRLKGCIMIDTKDLRITGSNVGGMQPFQESSDTKGEKTSRAMPPSRE
jgi:hypothetical protein